MPRLATALILATFPALPAAAQTVTGDAAASLLYPPKGGEVELTPGILPKDQAKMLEMVAKDQPYYAAIAISPEEGLMSEATMAAANHHTVEAASAVALSQCNAKKKGAAECVIVAVVRPTGWEARPLQLSSSATEDFSNYSGALAISAATGAWGIGASGDEAVAACAAKQQAATDCTVAIAD
ncbi:MAG: 5-aminolevulic acid synthase [Rhodobacter sp. CACIA14H1]|nr:MAG: 5-aminolevulic acid synthase [Rhodobacter sp. CACIA14H1]